MKKALVVMNTQHSLMEDQKRVLEENFSGWETFPVPAEGWTRKGMEEDIHLRLQEFDGAVVFASPIPILVKLCTISNIVVGTPHDVKVFHNDNRVAKEVPDGKGGVRLIHTVALDGWELV